MMERNVLGCAKPAIFCWAALCSLLGGAALFVFFLELLPPRQSKLALAFSGGFGLMLSVAGCLLWTNLCCNPLKDVEILPRLRERLRDDNLGNIQGDEHSPLVLH